MNCPHWLLALTIPFSRSDRAHTYPAGVGAGCTEGLFPDGLLRWRVSFGCRRALGGRSDGYVTLADARQTVNASVRAGFSRGDRPEPAADADRSGTSAHRRGCPPERPGSLEGGQRVTPSGGMR